MKKIAIVGGPGTGKTIVLVHRAIRLFKEGKKVILITKTKELAEILLCLINKLLVNHGIIVGCFPDGRDDSCDLWLCGNEMGLLDRHSPGHYKIRLLSSIPKEFKKTSFNIDHVLVDEAQDFYCRQEIYWLFIVLLLDNNIGITLSIDANQSVYRPDNLILMLKSSATVVHLSYCYRSTQEIIRCAKMLSESARTIHTKFLSERCDVVKPDAKDPNVTLDGFTRYSSYPTFYGLIGTPVIFRHCPESNLSDELNTAVNELKTQYKIADLAILVPSSGNVIRIRQIVSDFNVSTYKLSKGQEWFAGIVLVASESLKAIENVAEQDFPTLNSANSLYVAMTRFREKIIVIAVSNCEYLKLPQVGSFIENNRRQSCGALRKSTMLINKPADIHNYFEGVVKQLPLFKLPRNEALLHTLRIMETDFVNESLGNPSLEQHYSGIRDFQDMLRFIVYWISRFAPDGGDFGLTKKKHEGAVVEAFNYAQPYSKVYDFLSALERGHARMTADDNSKIITIKYLDESVGKLFALKWFNKSNERYNSLNGLFNKNLIDGLRPAIFELNGSVRHTKKGEFTYKRSSTVLYAFQKAAEELVSLQFSLPAEWIVGDYTLGEFRLFWVHVFKLSLIHAFALRYALESNSGSLYENTVYQDNTKVFIKPIAMHSGLSKGILEKIIQDLTYDVKIRHTDIMLQPFFQISGRIVFSPTVILTSEAERNLITLLNRSRSKEYEDLKNKKEDLMIADLAPPLREAGYIYKTQINLKENGELVTNIDLLLWDNSKQCLLIVELKWFNGADSTIEILNNDAGFEEGIRQITEVRSFLQRHPTYLAERFCISPSHIYYLVVSKVGLPSPFLKKEGILFVEAETFIEGIRDILQLELT